MTDGRPALLLPAGQSFYSGLPRPREVTARVRGGPHDGHSVDISTERKPGFRIRCNCGSGFDSRSNRGDPELAWMMTVQNDNE